MPVVGNDQDRSIVVVEVLLEPGNGFEVEVVGGFIEQHHFGFLEEDLRDQNAEFILGRDFLHQRIMGFGGNAEAHEEFRGLGLGGISVDVHELAFELTKAVGFGVVQIALGVKIFALFHDFPELGVALINGVQHGFVIEAVMILAQPTHFGFGVEKNSALIGALLAGEDFQEGGFSRAVRADDAVAATGGEGDTDFLE